MIEHSLSKVPLLGGRFPQVSGLRFIYDPDEPVGKRLKKMWVRRYVAPRKVLTTFKCEPFLTAAANSSECISLGFEWGTHDGGACYRHFMSADYSISCDDDRYAAWEGFAVLMTLLYPVGVPLFFAWLLYSIRNVRDDASDSGVVSLAFIQEAQERFRTLSLNHAARLAKHC